MATVRFTPIGGAGEIGGSCYLYEFFFKNRVVRVLIDCGILQEERFVTTIPDLSPLNNLRVDAVIFTHSHLDHIGAGPVLLRYCPKADFVATPPTWFNGQIMLRDALKIQKERQQEIFTKREMLNFVNRLEVEFSTDWFGVKGVDVRLWPAGHIRGAASVLMRVGNLEVLHTGDISFQATPTVNAAWPLPNDFQPRLITAEATYGPDSTLPQSSVRKDLVKSVRRVISRGGNVIVPAFSQGRTQDILLPLLRAGITPWTGGLAAGVIQSMLFSGDNRWVSDKDFGNLQNAKPLPSRRKDPGATEEIVHSSGEVVVAPSGWMMGRHSWSHFFASRWGGDDLNAIFLSGYQMPGYPSERLLLAPQGTEVPLDNTSVVKRAEVKNFRFSGHCGGDEVKDLIDSSGPEVVALVHGEEPGLSAQAENLRVPGRQVHTPANREPIEI